MGYAIMRFEKMKTTDIAGLAGSLSHTMRSRYTPNADPELTKNNKTWLGPSTPQGVADAIRERWPEKRRKDAIGVIEHFIGASPEFFKKHGGDGDEDAYFQGAIDWLKSHYGEENVISVVQHNDETSPHLAAYVVPLDLETGRLNARAWTGGRGICAAMQTSFQAFAGKPVGLERGVRGSKAEHTSIARWYAGQTDLDKRAQDVKHEEAGVTARQADVSQEQRDLAKRKHRLDARETAQNRRGSALDDQQAKTDQKAATVAADRRKLDEATEKLAERERSVQALSERAERLHEAAKAQEAEAADRERRLFALERELRSRGEKLEGGERALEQRQEEIDRAGAQLRKRLEDAKQKEADISARSSALDDRTAALDSRENALSSREQKLQHGEKSLAEQSAALDDREAALSPKEQRLQSGEKALSKQLDALDDREKRAQALESRVNAYVESRRPKELGAAERVSLTFAAMPDSQRIDAMSDYGVENPSMRAAITRLGWVSYDTGEVTPAGADALERYGGVQQQKARQEAWQARDLPASDGPGM